MKIYTLMENTVKNENFCCEHGLSLYVETARHKLIFASSPMVTTTMAVV